MAAVLKDLQLLDLEEERLCLQLLRRRRQRKRCNRERLVRPLATAKTRRKRQRRPGVVEATHFPYFKMSASSFCDLMDRVSPYMRWMRQSSVLDLSGKLDLTLRVLASGRPLGSVAKSFKLATSTVARSVSQTCRAIWLALKDRFVCFPDGPQRWKDVAGDFWRTWNFPNCLGCIAGKHVEVRRRGRSGEDRRDYNGTFSMVVMAACDANYRFTAVDVGASGQQSVEGLFRESEFGANLLEGKLDLPPPDVLPGTETSSPFVFVGDAAFPVCVNLISPYPGSDLTQDEQVYNYRHSRARNAAENAFGVLSARWRILSQRLSCSPQMAVDILKACVALHNFLSHADAGCAAEARYLTPGFADAVAASGRVRRGKWRRLVASDRSLLDLGRPSGSGASAAARAVRNNFKDFFVSCAARRDDVASRGKIN
ncbi:uncharacterized protein [Centroberyx affinis]|uniref:uncharacterized protein n=1 Tax=Centroberyx affinis TaxID=166261 RepID=UPI003A5BC7A4